MITPEAMATAEPTESPTSIPLNVSAEVKDVLVAEHVLTPDGMISTKLIHSEGGKEVTIVAETIQVTESTDSSVTKIITGKDSGDNRYIWNQEAKGWVTDLVLSQDWSHPETAPFLELSGFKDGSANLIVALYGSEHPGLISPHAPHPYYKVNAADNSDGSVSSYEISLFRSNQYLFKDQEETQSPLHKDALPFAEAGLIRTQSSGADIYTIATINANPAPEDANQTTNTFKGFDKSVYDDLNTYNKKINMDGFVNDHPLEFVIVLPDPIRPFNPDKFNWGTQQPNPAVAKLLSPNLISIFTPDDQRLIKEMMAKFYDPFDINNNPSSAAIAELPPKLSHMIVFTGLDGWEDPIQ